MRLQGNTGAVNGAGRSGIPQRLYILQRALGGEIVGRRLICPAIGRPPDDRSLVIEMARGGMAVRSRDAGVDLGAAVAHVIRLINCRFWEAGDDGIDRDVPAELIEQFDASALAVEAERRAAALLDLKGRPPRPPGRGRP